MHTPGISIIDTPLRGTEIGRFTIGRVIEDGDSFRAYNLAGREVGISNTKHGAVKILALSLRLPRSRRIVLAPLFQIPAWRVNRPTGRVQAPPEGGIEGVDEAEVTAFLNMINE